MTVVDRGPESSGTSPTGAPLTISPTTTVPVTTVQTTTVPAGAPERARPQTVAAPAATSAVEAPPPDATDGRQRWPTLLAVATLGLLLMVPIGLAIGLKYLDHMQASVESSGSSLVEAEPLSNGAAANGSSTDNRASEELGADCTITGQLSEGSTDDSVRCLEAKLRDQGYFNSTPDATFDSITAAAVEEFQNEHGLVVDGIVGPATERVIEAWSAEPNATAPNDATCPGDGHAAVIDRRSQRAWLCDGGAITKVLPMTSATTQPDPGSYEVFAKDMNSSSNLTGKHSTMTHFVAFTKGKYTGARVAFHSVPKYDDGSFVQPLSSVGTQERFGDSSGCIRVLPDDAAEIWDWLDIGDPVVVVT